MPIVVSCPDRIILTPEQQEIFWSALRMFVDMAYENPMHRPRMDEMADELRRTGTITPTFTAYHLTEEASK